MYIDKLSLRNFKCFEKVDISLSKITLLTGPNSSGKSSLLYGLLGPFQSEKFPSYLSLNGKYVNMGDFREVVFKNIKKRFIGIEIVTSDPDDKKEYTLRTEWTAHKHTMMPKLHHLESLTPFGRVEISAIGTTGAYILKLNYDPKKYLKGRSVEVVKVLKTVYELLDNLAAEVNKKRRKNKRSTFSFLKPLNVRGRRFASLEKLLQEFNIVEYFFFNLSFMKESINFISSFRLQPDRTYYQQSQPEEKVGTCGENYIHQILEWETQKAKRFQEIKSILKELKLLFSLKSKELPGGRFELRVKVKRGDIWASLVDVGFGISQFLPILVADLQLGKDSTLFVAQPEIHLHPSVQASLADYFVKQISEKKKRYIVETHSEYLLNRIRLAIVQGQLKPSDISVYYFDNTEAGTETCEIQFTENGQIKGAPEKFFETYMMDTVNIAMKAK
jgi:predicted ATPase